MWSSTLFLLGVASTTLSRAHMSDVVEADDVNFEEVIKKDDFVLMEFYAPWCGHCKNLAPEYEKAATQLKGRAVLAMLDAVENTKTTLEYKVTGFPALKIFRGGKFDKDYEGERNADGIVRYIKQETKQNVATLKTAQDVERFNEDKPNCTVYAVFPDTDSDLYKVFNETAALMQEQMRGSIAFALVEKSSGLTVAGLDTPDKITITIERFDESRGTLSGEKVLAKDAESFKKSIEENWLPTFAEMTRYTFSFYLSARKPVMMLFRSREDEESEGVLLSLAQKYYQPGQDKSLLFGWIDGDSEDAKSISKKLGVEEDKLPALLIDHPSSFTYHIIEKGGNPIDKEAVIKAIDSFPMGEAVSMEDLDRGVGLRGEELPAEYKGKETMKGLTTIVQSNFDEFALEADRDVFVFFWAPWCIKCRKIVQDLEKLAAKLENKRVRIAKFQASQNWYNKTIFDKNPISEDYKEFEPVYWFVPKSTHVPVHYEGKHTFKAMMGWLKKNAQEDVKAEDTEDEQKDDSDEL